MEHQCEGQHICLLSSTDPTGRACKCPDDLIEIIENGAKTCNPNNDTNRCNLKCHPGACKIVNNQPICICPIDYEGQFCEHYRCSGFCKNHGTCFVDVSNVRQYSNNEKPPLKCKCQQSWIGEKCEISESICRNLCHNGATCTVAKNGVEKCTCPPGYHGKNCQNCDELSCENQGICKKDENGKAMCECPEDYKGQRCEIILCEGYCSGHGQCTIRLGSPQCKCDSGFWGKQCQSDSCTNYCKNGGTCTITNSNTMTCQCLDKFTGLRCEQYQCNEDSCMNADTNPCDQTVCQNGGTCHTIENEAYCNCTSQWNGQYCQVKQHIINVIFVFYFISFHFLVDICSFR